MTSASADVIIFPIPDKVRRIAPGPDNIIAPAAAAGEEGEDPP